MTRPGLNKTKFHPFLWGSGATNFRAFPRAQKWEFQKNEKNSSGQYPKLPKNIKTGTYTPKMASRLKPKVWAKRTQNWPKMAPGGSGGGSKKYFLSYNTQKDAKKYPV